MPQDSRDVADELLSDLRDWERELGRIARSTAPDEELRRRLKELAARISEKFRKLE